VARPWIAVALLAAGVGLTGPRARASSHTGDPLNDLQHGTETLAAALRRRVPDWSPEADVVKERVTTTLGQMLDYAGIARQVMGTSWDGLTEPQRRAFLVRFSRLTNQAFVSALFRPEVRIRFDSETVRGSTATVRASVIASSHDRETTRSVAYQLTLNGDHWLIYDAVVNGDSMLADYRAEFGRLMRRGGFDEVMARMNRKLAAQVRRGADRR
jgi:ABC-type transporter MlaC component